MVVGIVAGVCRVFSLQVYVRQKTRSYKLYPGDFGYGGDLDNTAVGKSFQNFPGPAQLCELEKPLSHLLFLSDTYG